MRIGTVWTGGARACLVVVLAACGGAGATASPSASPSTPSSALPAVTEVTLTDKGCTSTPRDATAPGAIRLAIQNDSAGLASFELLRIDSTFAEFDAFLIEARKRIDAGEQPPTEIPNISDELDSVQVNAGASGELAADLTTGVHAVLCVVRGEHDDIVTVYAVGPYVVN